MVVVVVAKHLGVDRLAKVEGQRAQDVVLGARKRGVLRLGGQGGRHRALGLGWERGARARA